MSNKKRVVVIALNQSFVHKSLAIMDKSKQTTYVFSFWKHKKIAFFSLFFGGGWVTARKIIHPLQDSLLLQAQSLLLPLIGRGSSGHFFTVRRWMEARGVGMAQSQVDGQNSFSQETKRCEGPSSQKYTTAPLVMMPSIISDVYPVRHIPSSCLA